MIENLKKCSTSSGQNQIFLAQLSGRREASKASLPASNKKIFLAPHPCNTGKFWGTLCCHMTNQIGHNLKAIMKVMRIANGRGRSGMYVKELMNYFKPNINYTLTFESDKILDSGPIDDDMNTLLPWCELENNKSYFTETFEKTFKTDFKNVEKCKLFDPVITDLGICHSYNSVPTLDLLKKSYFTEIFEETFKTDFIEIRDIVNGTGSGSDYALNFYLMDGIDILRKTSEAPTSFLMSLSTKNEYFDLKSTKQIVKPGVHTIWKVQAMEIIPSLDLHYLSPDKRHCMFEDENQNLELFEKYSQTACEFECKIKQAEKACQCLPWYMPSISRSSICDVYGNYCFKSIMKSIMNNEKPWKKCQCLPTCHNIEFTYTKEYEKRDPNGICTEFPHTFEYNIARKLFKKGYTNSLAYKYHKVSEWINNKSNQTLNKWDLEKAKLELCKMLVKHHMAKVSVMFDRRKYVRTMTNLKVTFPDKLASFGKKIDMYLSNFIL